MSAKKAMGFHSYYDAKVRPLKLYEPAPAVGSKTTIKKHFVIQERELSYRFYTHFHPYVTELVSRLVEASVRGLQDADTDYRRNPNGSIRKLPDDTPWPVLRQQLFSADKYRPTAMVSDPRPVADLDFTSSGAYSVYNWELFFHVPLTIAIHLSKNQRFEDAQRWLHFIFDPTDDSADPSPERFWKVRPFHSTDVELIEDLLVNLSTNADPELRQQTINSIAAWKDAPFRPHVVARYRQSAYMFKTVMTYLDNLIAWGDSLFRQDTRETINEATQLYVLAANLLGPRPQPVPKKGSVRPQTYANFREDLDKFGNVLREVEADIPFDLAPHPTDASADERLATLRSLGNSLYFCVPRNDKLLGYWDIVADRLFKIRNSLNLQGVFRQLPLFAPPIDPGLLAKAAASGLDVGAVLAGLNQPLPLVRFGLLIQRATELCQNVKSLGASLLSAMEKEDGEALSILRAKHERAVLELTEVVRYGQWQEANKSIESLQVSLTNAFARYVHYEKLLGRQESDVELPEIEELDEDALERMRLRVAEPSIAPRPNPVVVLPDSEGRSLSVEETNELALSEQAKGKRGTAAVFQQIGAGFNMIPALGAFATPIGVGANVTVAGRDIASVFSFIAGFYSMEADSLTHSAGKTGKLGSYSRRQQDWTAQSNAAAGEINQLFKQLRAAQIRSAVAERELSAHRTQMKHAEEVERFLTEERKGKKTNRALHTWMKREVKGLYGQCYELAYDVAKRAERALQHELGAPDASYLRFDYQSGKHGLLSGEKLYLDIKRMETAYHDLNRREYEMTKSVSLLQVDPLALVQLRTTGRCAFTLPEALFDLDTPGHYFRRIRSVSVSVPAVTGPYVSLNCMLTQTKSVIRTSPRLDGGEYAASGENDSRFDMHFGSQQSIVTSTGRADAGLFEANLRDERYLPFEGSGAVGEWQLRLPADPRAGEPMQFDYDTISDVILHIRYTAREGGEQLRTAALAHVSDQIDAAAAAGSRRLFSVRHEFPTEWASFTTSPARDGFHELVLPLREQHYPFWSRGRLEAVKAVDLLARSAQNRVTVADRDVAVAPDVRLEDTLEKDDQYGGLRKGALTNVPLPDPVVAPGEEPFRLYLDDGQLSDLWVLVHWGAA